MSDFRVEYRLCDLQWAGEHEDVTHYDPTPCCGRTWDQIPWSKRLTYSVHDDEEKARDQYEVLREWERARSQPVRDVRLFVRKPGEWIEAPR